MSGSGVFRERRFESPLHMEYVEPHGEVLASQHGVLGKLLRHGELVDSKLGKGQHLLSVNGYHYVFEVIPESERQTIHRAFGVRGYPAFFETLQKVKSDLTALGVRLEHRRYELT